MTYIAIIAILVDGDPGPRAQDPLLHAESVGLWEMQHGRVDRVWDVNERFASFGFLQNPLFFNIIRSQTVKFPFV